MGAPRRRGADRHPGRVAGGDRLRRDRGRGRRLPAARSASPTSPSWASSSSRATPATVAAIVAELAGGARLAPGQAALADGTWWCPITAGRVLAVTPPETTASVRDALEAAAAAAAGLRLGARADHGPVLERGRRAAGARDASPGRRRSTCARSGSPEAAFAPVSVARVPGMILRERGDRFLHLFGAGYADYVWTVFTDAAAAARRARGRHRGLGPGVGRGRCVTCSASGGCGAARAS